MKDYKQLAIIYLKSNKRRSIITILGVVIAVAILYAGLNVALNFYDAGLADARENENYELMFFADSKEQREAICNDEEVISAYIGSNYDYVNEKVVDGVVFVNTRHPYSMMKTLDRMEKQYDVRGDYNGELALYYFASDDVNGIFIMALFIIWIAFIFAIIGVGIIRNSIQLNSLEQVKDFGILRCIGATKGQLRTFIYIMGAIMEALGVVIGVMIGYPVSAYISFMLHIGVGFHFLPILFVVVAYLFDLYFAMKECCKFVNDMTPVSAVKGEFRIRKEKIKIRNNTLMGKLFGLEGDYAYKSLRRNPGRFRKSVVAIGFGVAACMVVTWLLSISNSIVKSQTDLHGEYQLRCEAAGNWTYGIPMSDWDLYLGDPEVLKKISELDCVEEMRYGYSSSALFVNGNEFRSHVVQDKYMETTMLGHEVIWSEGDENDPIELMVEGLKEDELESLNDSLVEGSLELSESGIIAVRNGYYLEELDDDIFIGEAKTLYGQLMNYKVGDTVDMVDPVKYSHMVEERINQDKKDHPEKYDREKFGVDKGAAYDNVEKAVYNEMIENGDYYTYTVEAVVDGERYGVMMPIFITSVPTYSRMTGKPEDSPTEIKMRINEKRITGENLANLMLLVEESKVYMDVESAWTMELSANMKRAAAVVAGIVAFIVCMASLNIMNTTASSLHLRKKEFAQLRVIGMSKKRLMFTVMLEGIITTIGANVVGLVIAAGIIAALYPTIQEIYPIGIVIPWQALIVGLIGSGLILCGSVYIPMRELPVDAASDLTTDGD